MLTKKLRNAFRNAVADRDVKTFQSLFTSHYWNPNVWLWILHTFLGCGSRGWIECWRCYCIMSDSFVPPSDLCIDQTRQYIRDHCTLEEHMIFEPLSVELKINWDSFRHKFGLQDEPMKFVITRYIDAAKEYKTMDQNLGFRIALAIVDNDLDCAINPLKIIVESGGEVRALNSCAPRLTCTELAEFIFERMDATERSVVATQTHWKCTNVLRTFLRVCKVAPSELKVSFDRMSLTNMMTIVDVYGLGAAELAVTVPKANTRFHFACVKYGILHSSVGFAAAKFLAKDKPAAVVAIQKRFGQKRYPITASMVEPIDYIPGFGIDVLSVIFQYCDF